MTPEQCHHSSKSGVETLQWSPEGTSIKGNESKPSKWKAKIQLGRLYKVERPL